MVLLMEEAPLRIVLAPPRRRSGRRRLVVWLLVPRVRRQRVLRLPGEQPPDVRLRPEAASGSLRYLDPSLGRLLIKIAYVYAWNGGDNDAEESFLSFIPQPLWLSLSTRSVQRGEAKG